VVNASDTSHDCGPLFYMEDEQLEKKLLSLKESLVKIKANRTNESI